MVLIAQNKILMVEYDDYQFSLLKYFTLKHIIRNILTYNIKS